MRINIYSQELLTDPIGASPLTGDQYYHPHIEVVIQKSNTGVRYSAVRMFLHSAEELHHPPMDDDRSAITFWLPKSKSRREMVARQFEEMADLIRTAPAETGLD